MARQAVNSGGEQDKNGGDKKRPPSKSDWMLTGGPFLEGITLHYRSERDIYTTGLLNVKEKVQIY